MGDGFSQAVFIDCGIEYIGSDLMTDLGQERQKLIRQPSGEDRDTTNRVTIKSRHAGQEQKKLGSCQRSRREVAVERPQCRDRGMSGAAFVDIIGLPKLLLVPSVLADRGLCRVHMASPCVHCNNPPINGSPCLAGGSETSRTENAEATASPQAIFLPYFT